MSCTLWKLLTFPEYIHVGEIRANEKWN